MGRRLEATLPAGALARFQIFLDRVDGPDGSPPTGPDARIGRDGLIPLLWCHGQPGTLVGARADGGWRRFARVVFVSRWQAEQTVRLTGLPADRWTVLPN